MSLLLPRRKSCQAVERAVAVPEDQLSDRELFTQRQGSYFLLTWRQLEVLTQHVPGDLSSPVGLEWDTPVAAEMMIREK